MKHHITLLALGFQVWQTFPVDQIFGTCDGSRSSSSAKVAGLSIVVTLGTEYAIYPSILMGGKTHIVDIGSGNHIFRHRDRLIPETEVIHTIGTFCHSEEALAVCTFHANYQQILAIPFDGTRIEGSIHHDALHQIGVILFVKVITPLQRSMFCSKNRILPTVIDTVTPLFHFIFLGQQRLMMSTQNLYFFVKIAHFVLMIYCFIII